MTKVQYRKRVKAYEKAYRLLFDGFLKEMKIGKTLQLEMRRFLARYEKHRLLNAEKLFKFDL